MPSTAELTTSIYDAFAGYVGRPPTSLEIDTWLQSLASSSNAAQSLRAGLLATTEGRANTSAQINSIYQSLAGRAPAANELTAWTSYIETGGGSFEGIGQSVLGTVGTVSAINIALNALYQDLLGRGPTSAELSNDRELVTTTQDFSAIRRGLLTNSEGIVHLNDTLHDLYAALAPVDFTSADQFAWFDSLYSGGVSFNAIRADLMLAPGGTATHLSGTGAADNFTLAGQVAEVSIVSFNPLDDVVRLDGAVYQGIDPLDAEHAAQILSLDGVTPNVLLTFSSNSHLLLHGVTLGQLSSANVVVTPVPTPIPTPVPTPSPVVIRNDFNGDGRSDILWRSTDGTISNWLSQGLSSASNDSNALVKVDTEWQVAGTGDFNGDGRADILWRSASGQMSDWLGTTAGGFIGNDSNALVTVPRSWHIAGTGDFNGDGKTDILWRSDDGGLSNWLSKGLGFTPNDAAAFKRVGTDWQVVGTGDFNGDGRDDILWRNLTTGALSDWLGQSDGGFVGNDVSAFSIVPTTWTVVGTGDFNGDGRADVLWRSTDGTLSNWLGRVDGGFATNDANAMRRVGTDWHVVDTGDFNGDGRTDILWRNDNGAVSNWLGTSAGGFAVNDANFLLMVPSTWKVQAPDHPFV